MELHGGTIGVGSPGLGHGATFTIRLPRVIDDDAGSHDDAGVPPSAHRAEDSGQVPSLVGVNVLLVDDDEDPLTMFRDMLEEAGACVRAVSSGADALRATDTWTPHLLVVDLGLSGMDGYELLRAIRIRSAPRVYRRSPSVPTRGSLTGPGAGCRV